MHQPIHQFVHTLNYGDAISGEAISLQRIFRERGIGGEIFSIHAHEKVKQFVTDWREFSTRAKKGDKVLLHHSIASPLNELFLGAEHCSRYMIYHNLTPEKWFLSYNARVLADLRVGRKELPELVKFRGRILADSEFNKRELEEVGATGVRVLPLPLDTEKWSVTANPGIAQILRGHGGKNLLHVGRLAPNKRIEDVIRAFYFYHHKLNRHSRLWLIGADTDTELYSFELRRLVSDLRLKEGVTFVGSVADSELRAFYENSDLYLCMSEHEGFCVPLIEAMYFGLPLIAFNAGAVSETVGEGGVLIDQKDPALLAELMHYVLSNGEVRTEMVQAGREQLRHFLLPRFCELVEELIINDSPC